MGCDMHLYVEKKKKGKWVSAQGMVYDEEKKLHDVPLPDRFYQGRNYYLFGFLAGVRKEEVQNFKVKGFPENASNEVKKLFNSWGEDGHTPSYLTLKELKGVDWKDRKIKISGMKDKKELEKLKKELKKKEPKYELLYPYCSWGSGKNMVNFECEIPISFYFKDFIERVEDLSWYDWNCKSEEIRIVFWFDN